MDENLLGGEAVNMDLRLLRTFQAVAELENITQAAERLNFTQPTVTAQIRQLEEHFGVRLFERLGKRLYITEAGRFLACQSANLLILYEKLEGQMQDFTERPEEVRLGISSPLMNYHLSSVVRHFRREKANLSLQVDLCLSGAEVVSGLLNNRFAVGLLHEKPVSSLLRLFFWRQEAMLWVGCPEIVSLCLGKSAAEWPYLSFRSGTVMREKSKGVMQEQEPEALAEYSDSEGVKRAVLDGLGVAFLPERLVQAEVAAGLLAILPDAPAGQLELWAAVHRDKEPTPGRKELFAALGIEIKE
jgi:DNA-binding transcriptional LysR family regulator